MRKLIPVLLAVGLLLVWAMPVAALSAADLLGDSCHWSEDSPPTVESVAAGSNVVSSAVTMHTETKAGTSMAPRLSFSITADGEGTVSAGMEVRSLSGLDGWSLGSVETFSDHITASGIWQFAKVMSYNSVAALPAVMPGPWYLVP